MAYEMYNDVSFIIDEASKVGVDISPNLALDLMNIARGDKALVVLAIQRTKGLEQCKIFIQNELFDRIEDKLDKEA